MAVLAPLKVILSDLPEDMKSVQALDYPFDASRGSHEVPMSRELYIDASDFRMIDSEDYYGLAPNKIVGLKYAFRIRCDHVDVDTDGKATLLHCSIVTETDIKVKGTIQWVPAISAITAEVRMYNYLFLTEEPSDEHWEKELNPASEVVVNAMIDPSLKTYYQLHGNANPHTHFQFERIGFFVVDKDSIFEADNMKIVFNLTVSLKDSKPVATSDTKAAGGANRSRKEEQAKQLAEKMARKSIPPSEYFKSMVDLYSAFDEDGVPTHDAKGEKLSKSAMKNLKKEWEKQKKLYESA
jgi:glutaminyl-tRNA synthetase